MTFAKVVLHQLRSALGNAQIGADVAHQLLLVDGADAAERVGFHVLVQQFIGIQFRAVGRKPEELDARRVLCQPATHRRRLVHGVAIQNQKHFPGDQTQQATQKIQKDRRGEALVKNHEGQSTAIGEGRDQVAAEALTGARHHGRLAAASIGAAGLMVGAQPHLVAPVNLGLFSLGLRPDGRVFLLQPSPHGGRVLFVGAPHRLLWRQTPGPQIAPHRPDRHVHAEPSGQQLLHRFPRPQRERQTQLVRAPAQNQPHGGGCLRRSQARAGRPSATPGLQPRTPFSLPKAHPAVDRSSRHPEQPRGLGLCKALANRLHHKPAQSLLRLGRKRTRILSFHVPNDGPDSGTCQLFYAPISNGREGTSYGRLARSWRSRVGWRPQMPTYQVLYPPFSELYIDVSFSWSLLLGYLILASAAGLWAVWDARRQPSGPKLYN